MKLKAIVPEAVSAEIKWLVIESDKADTGGYFLYHHLSEEMAYDDWFAKTGVCVCICSNAVRREEEEWIRLDGKIED